MPPLESQKSFEVAIVGGGVCGLTCALALVKEGVPVTVYEAAVRPLVLLTLFRVHTSTTVSFRRNWSGHRNWYVDWYTIAACHFESDIRKRCQCTESPW